MERKRRERKIRLVQGKPPIYTAEHKTADVYQIEVNGGILYRAMQNTTTYAYDTIEEAIAKADEMDKRAWR